jgi:hypothetical protein
MGLFCGVAGSICTFLYRVAVRPMFHVKHFLRQDSAAPLTPLAALC